MNFVPEVFLRQWRGLEEESKPSIAAAVVVCGRERERERYTSGVESTRAFFS